MRQNPHVRICGGPGSATTLVYPTTDPRQCRLCTSLQLAIGPARYTRNLCPGIVYLPLVGVDFGFKSGFFPYGHRPARIIGSMFSASVLGQNLKLRWPRV